jgi:hypothetical protein
MCVLRISRRDVTDCDLLADRLGRSSADENEQSQGNEAHRA